MDMAKFLVDDGASGISPLEEETAGRPERVGLTGLGFLSQKDVGALRAATPSLAFDDISSSKGEIACAYSIVAESVTDVSPREALLDRAMGQKRRKKSSEKLRRGRRPSEGLAFVARDVSGAVVGTVRLWDVRLGEGGPAALLLGPLAVALLRLP